EFQQVLAASAAGGGGGEDTDTMQWSVFAALVRGDQLRGVRKGALSAMDEPALGRLRLLVDQDSDGRLSFHEFVAARQLLARVAAGKALPQKLPTMLRADAQELSFLAQAKMRMEFGHADKDRDGL